MLEFVRHGLTSEQVTENGKKMLGKDLIQNGINNVVNILTFREVFC